MVVPGFNDKNDKWTVDYFSAYPDTSKLNDFFPNGKRDYLKETVEVGDLPKDILHSLKKALIWKFSLWKNKIWKYACY